MDDQALIHYLTIGRYAEVIYRKGKSKRMSVDNAVEIAAKRFHVSPSKAKTARDVFLDSVAKMNKAIADMKSSDSQDT